jgi:hypothetical protein
MRKWRQPPNGASSQAKAGISRYIDFYNTARPHSSLDKQTPDEFYFATLPAIKQASMSGEQLCTMSDPQGSTYRSQFGCNPETR